MMMKTIQILLRGAVADSAQAFHDANAVAILRQQVRDAAAALGNARRELAVAMAYQAAEQRALDALASRIETLAASARKALADGREDLGREAASLIAALQDERADRGAAVEGFGSEVARLRRLIGQGETRLRDLDRGLQTARAAEAVRRAGINGRGVVSLSGGARGEAEETLARLRERRHRDDDVADALAALDAAAQGDVESRLEAGGYGRRRTDPEAVLESLKAAPGASNRM
ncbi:PspA/IM30 family protein [Enterovirga sp.]|uniref:PspA/IM30 family protein n=1 Tax=Enterovirga sp. TaxID=2026350 RepID=UPI002CC49B4F|nr:PspA/IM30 family protein [Enterovirga sp.]HMO28809.1 PspA/IM30 family protein [Enterovirga sp.]